MTSLWILGFISIVILIISYCILSALNNINYSIKDIYRYGLGVDDKFSVSSTRKYNVKLLNLKVKLWGFIETRVSI